MRNACVLECTLTYAGVSVRIGVYAPVLLCTQRTGLFAYLPLFSSAQLFVAVRTRAHQCVDVRTRR